MEIAAALAADLDELSGALQEPGVDVTVALRQLGADVKAAVRSFVGLSLTLRIDGEAVTLAGRDAGHAQVLSSLAMPLSSLTRARSIGELVLYGSRRGAFVDLAADLGWATGADSTAFVLDGHREVDLSAFVPSGLAELSAINQAIGALLDQGFTPEHGRTELDRRARRAGLDTAVFARGMLTALIRLPDTGAAQ